MHFLFFNLLEMCIPVLSFFFFGLLLLMELLFVFFFCFFFAEKEQLVDDQSNFQGAKAHLEVSFFLTYSQ